MCGKPLDKDLALGMCEEKITLKNIFQSHESVYFAETWKAIIAGNYTKGSSLSSFIYC